MEVPEEISEKKELLTRVEIRTMKKDIEKLREEEAEKEKNRIADLKLEEIRVPEKTEELTEREKAEEEAKKRFLEIMRRKEELKKEEEIKPEKIEEKEGIEAKTEYQEPIPTEPEPEAKPKPEEEKPQEALPEEKTEEKIEEIKKEEIAPEIKEVPKILPKIKPPSLPEKVFVRGIIIVILTLIFVNLFLFWYWYFHQRVEKPSSGTTSGEELPVSGSPQPGAPETPSPESLIPFKTTEILEVSRLSELPNSLSQTLKKDFKENEFVEIVIKKDGKTLSLKEFFEALEIKTPENFSDFFLKDSFSFFVFPQKEGKRLGFLLHYRQDLPFSAFLEMENLTKSWEQTMEKDFEKFFSLLGKTEPALVPYFRETDYQNVTLRYQTFSRQDFGICYSLPKNNDLFIFTSSLKSLKSALDYVTVAP